ncbi:MAG: DUF3365 domain-containing protein [Campylobacterales bacterium]|nr:DUF3365 domain-containing protein [Campylobacterales bacterium]
MNRKTLIALACISSFLVAAPVSEEHAISKGAAASAALLQKLGGEVKTNMQANGPVKTVEFCSLNALSLTDQIAKETKTQIKRLSLKNRNPVNAAAGEEKALLEKWEKMVQNGQSLPSHELKKTADGGMVYYKPLLINNEACLKCHGNIAEGSPLTQAIRSTYPEDKAVGYKMGDLRGMIEVKISQ